MHPCKGIFLSCNPNTSLRPLYIFPVQNFLQHLIRKRKYSIFNSIMIQLKIRNSLNGWVTMVGGGKFFMEIIYVQVEIKWRMIWKYLNMFKRQRDSHRTHHFLWQRPLTTRPPECINHDMITIIFFTICRMWVVILRLFCAQVMRLSCWCSLDQFLSNKTKLISTKNWVIFKRMPEWSFFMILTRPKTTSWTKQTNIFQDHYRGFFKFHKLTGGLIKKCIINENNNDNSAILFNMVLHL